MANSSRRHEWGIALYFVAALVAPFLPVLLAPGYPLPTRIAGGGGLLAAPGGLAIIRPVIRAGGPFNWITLEVVGEEFDGEGELQSRIARVNDPDALKVDRFMQHILGPFFVSIGTLLNGFSGFFA